MKKKLLSLIAAGLMVGSASHAAIFHLDDVPPANSPLYIKAALHRLKPSNETITNEYNDGYYITTHVQKGIQGFMVYRTTPNRYDDYFFNTQPMRFNPFVASREGETFRSYVERVKIQKDRLVNKYRAIVQSSLNTDEQQ